MIMDVAVELDGLQDSPALRARVLRAIEVAMDGMTTDGNQYAVEDITDRHDDLCYCEH